jgi:DNA-binding Lrp family transcriptional regulator
MELSALDRALLDIVAKGLPLVPQPFAAIARPLGLTEDEVLIRLSELLDAGLIKRLGVVVRHRELGYRANAMVVWDVPDSEVSEIGRRMARAPFVTLCYRRPRRPGWPYNLFCMIHGRDRANVETQVATLAADLGLAQIPRAVLFSTQCFKQRGAHYRASVASPHLEVAE